MDEKSISVLTPKEVGFGKQAIHRYGKPIDSERLKIAVDKRQSIESARRASLAVPPGPELSACPVCDAKKRSKISDVYGFSYVRCESCETAYVSNRPSEVHLEEIYKSSYYTESNRRLYANPDILDYRLRNIALPKVEFVLESIRPAPASWLDIGCGTGEILNAVREKKLRVVGAETNAMQREFAKKTFGLEIFDQYVTPQNVASLGGPFDVVSLFSVLEHVLDPRMLMKSVSAIQKAGTHLVIEVPHFPSLSAATQAAFPDMINRMMHPPLHLFLFSVKSLKMLLDEAGYEVKHCWFFGQDVFEFLTTTFLQTPQLANSELEKMLISLVGDFQKCVDVRGLSDEMLVVAVKK